MDKEVFRQFGHRFVDWAADYMIEVAKFPVMSQLKPGEIRSQLPENPPQHGESMERIFEDFKEIILPGLPIFQPTTVPPLYWQNC